MIPVDLADLPAKLAKRGREINEHIAFIEQQRRELDGRIARFLDDGIADDEAGPQDRSHLMLAETDRAAAYALICDEIAFRREQIAPFLQQRRDALADAAGAARDALMAQRAKVTDQLVSIGYLPPAAGPPQRGTILPGWIEAHPEVRTARERYEALYQRSRDDSHARHNDAAAAEATAQRQEMRRRAVAMA